MKRIAEVGILISTRTLFHLIWFFSSVYSLLAYVPFTFRQVLSINLIPALGKFATLQPALVVLATLLLAGSIFRFEKKKKVSTEDRRELIFISLLALGLGIWNLPAHLENDWRSLAWSFACLIPPLWLALFDLRELPEIEVQTDRSLRLILCAIASGVVTSLLFAQGRSDMKLAHLFAAGFAAASGVALLCIFEQVLLFMRARLRSRFIGYGLSLGALVTYFAFAKLCAAISFFGPLAFFWSLLFGLAIGLALAAFSARILKAFDHVEASTASFRLFADGFGLFSNRLAMIVFSIAVIAFLPTLITQSIGVLDWNGLLLQFSSVFVCVLVFLRIYKLSHLVHFRKTWMLDAFYSAATILTITGLVFFARGAEELRADVKSEPFFAFSKPLIFSDRVSNDFFHYLQAHTNLPRTELIELKDRPLSPVVKPISVKPNIFVFIIDSLRRDYLSPYNSGVTFTPEIAAFAKESNVFENAFTRYGATGLSEPSIWAGRMFPHQMYPKPFYAINQLQKLIDAENYAAWVSRDSILEEILRPSPNYDDLDRGIGTQDLDLCATTKEISTRLEKNLSQPIFVYSQPQNIHVSVLSRKSAPASEAYPGFNGTYATALNRIDKCFGEFIAILKARGLYDQSVIVLSSDHGDSLGEEGRFGHAYTVFPEVIRIPLIVHVPTSLKSDLKERSDVVFSTDIAPTLSFLLGHESKPTDWSEGRSLFYRENPTLPLEKEHLVLSSYGPVAGLLSADGKSLYISDAVNFTNYSYVIDEKGAVNAGRALEIKDEKETAIKQKIDQLYALFGL